jgi:release factor glutamine methyltransferase
VTTTSTTWRQLLVEAQRVLPEEAEARRIVEAATGCDGADYLDALDRAAADHARRHFDAMVERRRSGEPLQYVLGSWGFRRLDLYLDRRVLIPRPETEMVVEVALDEARRLGRQPLLVDLGTGSGAIALSLALEVPGAEVWATDVSADALEVARANLAGVGSLAASQVRLRSGCWFGALPTTLQGRVAMVVANPPYVADGEPLPSEVTDWEPSVALRAGPTGLEQIEEIVKQATAWLARPGAVVVEIAPDQASPARALAAAAGYAEVEVHRDLAGRDRMVVGRF